MERNLALRTEVKGEYKDNERNGKFVLGGPDDDGEIVTYV